MPSGYERCDDYGGPKPSRWTCELAALVIAVMLAATVVAVLRAWAGEISGPVASITDGDTFRLGPHAIRLCGIDAPERGEPGYGEAADALREIVSGRTITCIQVGDGTVCDGRSRPTNRGRIVAQCFVGGDDIADMLIERGMACDWTRFSGGHYSRDGWRKC